MPETRKKSDEMPPWAIRVIAGVLVAAIPWGYLVERRIASMEAQFKSLASSITKVQTRQIPPAWFLDRVDRLEKRILDLER